MIKPTIGRIVWFWPPIVRPSQPMAALITWVHDDRCVNLSVFNRHGQQFSLEDVTLVQEGDDFPPGRYAEWMPYQVGQAKKHEQLELPL